MHFRRYLPLLLSFFSAGLSQLGAEPIDVAVRQFRTSYLAGSGQGLTGYVAPGGDAENQKQRALRHAAALKEDGSWPDVDYSNNARSNWRPYEHVQRLLQLSVQLAGSSLSPEERARLQHACVSGGAFWRSHDFKCPNWWYNEIGVPQAFATYALLMGDRLPKEDLNYIVGTVLERCGLRMTGQNRVWLAGNTLMQGLLQRDEAKVAAAADTVWSEIVVSEKEGIQADWSFHQHGPQLQFGNYGLAFAGEEARWMRVLKGTPWDLPPEKAEIFRNYLLDGLGWVCWHGFMDLGSCGRQIFPNSQQSKARAVRRIFDEMKDVDLAASAAYRAAFARGEKGASNNLEGNRYFWRSDYAIHRTARLFFSLRMSSSRVIGTELVNSENLRGRYIADGVLIPLVRGDEFADIYPVWDWRHLPGTTLVWKTEAPRTGRGDDRLLSRWTGAVGNGSEGCAALAYERDGVKASKAWFFFGDSVLCLGAGISGKERLPVHTTLNQCLLRGPVTATNQDGSVVTVAAGERVFPSLAYLDHDGLRYRFFQPARVTVASRRQTGNWSLVYQNPGTPKEDLGKEVLSLWIDHDLQPLGANYAYAIGPTSMSDGQATILANTEDLQAARWGNDTWQAVLWKPGSLELAHGVVFETDQPCLLLAKRNGTGWTLSLADPSQNLRQLTVAFGGKTRSLELPSGLHAGSTLTTTW